MHSVVIEMLVASPGDWTAAGLTLKIGSDGKLHLYRTGTTIDAVPPHNLANVSGVAVTGQINVDDTLTVDFGNGNPIPAGPPGGLAFDGQTGGVNTLVILGTSAAENTTMTGTPAQITVNGSTALSYNNVVNLVFNLGSGADSLMIDHSTLNLYQDGAISAGTGVTLNGGVLNFNGHADAIGDLTVIGNGQASVANINNSTTTVTSGTLQASSIICDTLTFGTGSAVANIIAATVDAANTACGSTALAPEVPQRNANHLPTHKTAEIAGPNSTAGDSPALVEQTQSEQP